MHAAERDAHIFATQCLGHGLAQRSLADTGRAYKTQDGRLGVLAQLKHRHLLDDAVFYLIKRVMVAVQYTFHVLEVEIAAVTVKPGQVQERIEV